MKTKKKLTKAALQMIAKGDVFLRDAGIVKGGGNEAVSFKGKNTYANDVDFYRVSIARVWFERARLEMEMDK
jgi:hypothetical protein